MFFVCGVNKELIMFVVDYIILLSVVFVILGVFVSKFFLCFGVFVFVFFLGVGMLVGEDGIGCIYFDNVDIVYFIGIFVLIFILFDGGL